MKEIGFIVLRDDGLPAWEQCTDGTERPIIVSDDCLGEAQLIADEHNRIFGSSWTVQPVVMAWAEDTPSVTLPN